MITTPKSMAYPQKYPQIKEHDLKLYSIVIHANTHFLAVKCVITYLNEWKEGKLTFHELPDGNNYTFKEAYTLSTSDPKFTINTASKLIWWDNRDVSNENLWLIVYSIF